MDTQKNELYKAINYYFDYGFISFPINLIINEKNLKKQFEPSIRWEKSKITRNKSLRLLEVGNYNSIALKTGKESNLFVLDVDRNDKFSGLESLESLRILIPPDTPCTITPSKGIHYYFLFPDELIHCNTGSNKNLLLDWRGNGGIIFVPPSHPLNGNPYKWYLTLGQGVLRMPPESLIQWILNLNTFDAHERKFELNKALTEVSERQFNWFLTTKEKCRNMPKGYRSEKDFDLLCVGIKIGLNKDVLFNEVKDISKFEERGLEYFNRTYEKALQSVDSQINENVIQ